MSGRIRSIKPEVLEDEEATNLSDPAWRLWVASWVLADDHGRFRAGLKILAAAVWHNTGRLKKTEKALKELVDKKFVRLYRVENQTYGELKQRSWRAHQRIDHPGKPRVPVPSDSDYLDGNPRTTPVNGARHPETLAPPVESLDDSRLSRTRARPPTSDLIPPTDDPEPTDTAAGEANGHAKGNGAPVPALATTKPTEADGDTGYDIARRVFTAAWRAKYGEEYLFATHTGVKGDDQTLMRLGALARRYAGEATMRHWVSSYLADSDPYLTQERHPIRPLEGRLNKYGTKPGPSPLATRPDTPAPRMPTDAEAAATKARWDAGRAEREAILANLEAKRGSGTR